jgi:hypothetical protein
MYRQPLPVAISNSAAAHALCQSCRFVLIPRNRPVKATGRKLSGIKRRVSWMKQYVLDKPSLY